MNKRRLLRLWQKPSAERHLDSELQFHVEQQIADYIAAGMSPQEASGRARAEFGGVELYKEECRDTRWENQLDIFVRDLRFAVRGLLKDRRFAFVSILVLALAIGASTAVFSVVENALVEPFPYRDQRNLVVVHIRDLDQSENSRSFFTMPEIQEIRKQNSVFESIANNQQDDVISRGSESSTGLTATSLRRAVSIFSVSLPLSAVRSKMQTISPPRPLCLCCVTEAGKVSSIPILG